MPKRKNKNAVAMGRLGGKARAKALSKAERIRIATQASHSRKIYLDATIKTA